MNGIRVTNGTESPLSALMTSEFSRLASAKQKVKYDEVFEQTELFRLIQESTKESLYQALNVVDAMTETSIKQKSDTTGNTFLHHLVGNSLQIHKNSGGDLSVAFPLVYRLSIKGVEVNMRNGVGNTCLHIACFKPFADGFCEHLIRIGCDPCITNERGCRVVHCFNHRICHIVKRQPHAYSGIWSAVKRELYSTVEMYLKSWIRVDVRCGRKLLRDTCEETGNLEIKRLLEEWHPRAEFIHAVLGGQLDLAKELLREAGRNVVNITDASYSVPKPLIVAVRELGEPLRNMYDFLINNGANGIQAYEENLQNWKTAFHSSPLYQKLIEHTEESLLDAITLVREGEVDLRLKSFKEEDDGWTYLHLLSHVYHETEVNCRKYLIRLLYMFALAGIDINARTKDGRTALLMSYHDQDQSLVFHMLRIGVDASLGTPSGESLAIENYQFKGKIVKGIRHHRKDQPGLWVAVEDGDLNKVRVWLAKWCRVHTTKTDRLLKDVATAMQYSEIAALLEQQEHTSEFVTAVFACDVPRIKNLLALGKGKCNVNPIEPDFNAGYRKDFSVEHVRRPLIIPAIDMCTADVVKLLIRFGSDLSMQYEGKAPCGPTAFWAFQDHVDSQITLVVAQNADVNLRDERGASLLHKAIKQRVKNFSEKESIIRALLERRIDVALRDIDGLTARDYIDNFDIEFKDRLKRIVDDFVVFKVTNDETYVVEEYILASYDHILDVEDSTKKKGARELAYLNNLKEMLELLDDSEAYTEKIQETLQAARDGDLKYISKHCQEKRIIWGKDKGGRSVLHLAVLYGHADMVRFLTQQFPDLVHARDNLLRTPAHYAACHSEKKKLFGLVMAGGSNNLAVDVNDLNVLEYGDEMDRETPCKVKPIGRQFYDYKVRKVIDMEMEKVKAGI